MRLITALVTAGILSTAAAASAQTAPPVQEKDSLGVTMGFPTTVGLLWQATDRLAVRPDLTLSGNSFGSDASGTSSSSSSIGLGVSVLFYLKDYDHLRTYVAPRLAMMRASTSTTSTFGASVTTKSSRHQTEGSGFFGVQYKAADRFQIYGETGLTFSHLSIPSTLTGSSIGNHTWALRGGVGVIFYP